MQAFIHSLVYKRSITHDDDKELICKNLTMSISVSGSAFEIRTLNASPFDGNIVNTTIVTPTIRSDSLREATESSAISTDVGSEPNAIARGGIILTDSSHGSLTGGSWLSSLGNIAKAVAPHVANWGCQTLRNRGIIPGQQAASGGANNSDVTPWAQQVISNSNTGYGGSVRAGVKRSRWSDLVA